MSAVGQPATPIRSFLTTFHLSDATDRLNQLRYDLRRLKGHALLQREQLVTPIASPPRRPVALLFLLFDKRLCGPLANSRFHHRPDTQHEAGQQNRNGLPPRRQSHSTNC